jgi:hypothetical protein
MVFMQNYFELKQPRFDVAEILIDFQNTDLQKIVKKLHYIENAFGAELENSETFI